MLSLVVEMRQLAAQPLALEPVAPFLALWPGASAVLYLWRGGNLVQKSEITG